MISVTELKAGAVFQHEGRPYQVLAYKHTKLGRGNANIRLKVKDLLSGALVKKNFVSGRYVEPIQTESKVLQYLYQQNEVFYFMDPVNFEQFTLPAVLVGEKKQFLLEGARVKVLFWGDKVLELALPNSLVFKVSQAPPEKRGDTATASLKPITLENGLVVKAPSFVQVGDRVKVDTRTGNYVARVK